MEEIRITRKSLPHRIAVATVAAVAMVAGVGMAPAGADKLKAGADGGVAVKVRNGTVIGFDAGVYID